MDFRELNQHRLFPCFLIIHGYCCCCLLRSDDLLVRFSSVGGVIHGGVMIALISGTLVGPRTGEKKRELFLVWSSRNRRIRGGGGGGVSEFAGVGGVVPLGLVEGG